MGLTCVYFAIFGMWNSTMLSLASITFAVPVGLAVGLGLGILSFRHPRFKEALTVVLDLMQTVPFFSYMVPIVVLFGVSPVGAMVATIIFSVPPMVRITDIALRSVPAETVDFGTMAGCRDRQLMWHVRIPASRDILLVGLNQVIMLTLNLVILASVIGARGIGFDVWSALNRLLIGKGLEYGLAIVILAIALDRYSRALALRRPSSLAATGASFWTRHPWWISAACYFVLSCLLSIFIPSLAVWPKTLAVSTAPFWDWLMTWINVNWGDAILAARDFFVVTVLLPIKALLRALPWVGVVAALTLAGWRLGGLKLAALGASVTLAIAYFGLWDKAVLTIYECGAAVLVCIVIGFPLGVWAARSDRVWRVLEPVADMLQTIPSFIFLIPFIILFRLGEFTAILIVVSFAIVPAIRYTAQGIRQVPPSLVEVARAQGCNEWQVLTEVQLPLALPQILLGLNQTIMMALSMLVITAYAGTEDLGQSSLAGVMKRDLGKSVIAGLAIALIAILTDRLNISFGVNEGEVFGVIGHNGAGKSTVL